MNPLEIFKPVLGGAASASAMSVEKPLKYQSGKINPEWVVWKEQQNRAAGSPAAATTVPNLEKAPPVISNMEEKMQFEEGSGKELKLTPSAEAVMMTIQSPNYASGIGLDSEEVVDTLGIVMAKYEIPLGLAGKLMGLDKYAYLEFIIDDSGSMRSFTDSNDTDGRKRTRKDEALSRILEMVEVLCYVSAPSMKFRFLNHENGGVCLTLSREADKPQDYFLRAKAKIESMWNQPKWRYSTPMFETMEKSFSEGAGRKVIRYIFGDGVPDDTEDSIPKIQNLLQRRIKPMDNPVTFMSCTNDDNATVWMKEMEEKEKACSESDDFIDEKREVVRDQGEAIPYSKGYYIICELVAAMNPNDLDCMDESVPFSKHDFDETMGYETSIDSYRTYFDCFLEAQKSRGYEYRKSRSDVIKNQMNWKPLYDNLVQIEHASDLPEVRAYRISLGKS